MNAPSALRTALNQLSLQHPTLLAYEPDLPDPRYFVVHTTTLGAVSNGLAIARAADVSFNPGHWLTPCSMTIPERLDDLAAWADMLKEAGIEGHLSFHDAAAY